MPLNVCITVDLEQDCPPYFSSYRGVEEGVSPLLELFAAEKIPVTFFSTGEIARRYPEVLRDIVRQNHELGCHGDSHSLFEHLSPGEARAEIRQSTRILRRFYPVTSFRAPYLRFPDRYIPFLEEEGYTVDSSLAKYKFFRAPRFQKTALKRIPASITSSLLRLPKFLRSPLLASLKKPVVLFVHPWEFVSFREKKMRWDCRAGTGPSALRCLRETIRFFKKRKASFLTMAVLA